MRLKFTIEKIRQNMLRFVLAVLLCTAVFSVAYAATGSLNFREASSTSSNNSSISSSSNSVSNTSSIVTSILTTGNGYQYNVSSTYSSSSSPLFFLAGVMSLVIAIAALYSIIRIEDLSAKFVALGIALILLSTIMWLYGSYVSNKVYSWLGVAGIIVGTMIWISEDIMDEDFRMLEKSSMLMLLGLLLIILSVGIWIYGDYGGGLQYVWPGVIGILLGILIWIYGESKVD